MSTMINTLAHANGWDSIFIGTMALAAVQVVVWMGRDPRVRARGWMALVRHDSLRILAGGMLLFVGVGARLADSLVRRSLILHDHVSGVRVLEVFGNGLIIIGAMLAVAGATLIMWPYLQDRFGAVAPLMVLVASFFMYVAGVLLTGLIPGVVF